MDDDIWHRAPDLNFENEAAVETRFIVPLLRALGYSETDHIAPKYKVVFQEGRRGRRPEADFVVFAERPHSRATSLITVEAKHPSEELTGGKEQGESYAANVRSPLLLLSNGRLMQLWQYQPTYESVLVLECSVAELPAQRGKIEILLEREAVLSYARKMQHKSFGLLARDLGAFERAEFERADGAGTAISRMLKDLGSGSYAVASTDLLANYLDGATLLAASGYGKTTLARELRRQALERRWSGESRRLAIEVFLPDVPPSQDGLETFLCSRVAAHCPQITPAAFRDRLRDDGIVLLGDGFDRVQTEHRSKVEGALVTFRRDFPKTQLFVFTRAIASPERLALPSLELLELNDDEQHELVERFSIAEGKKEPSFWRRVPDVLQALCRHPLILQLTLAHYKERGHLPTRIEDLFGTWLGRLLPNSLPLARRSDLRRLLASFANATVDGPLSEDAAVDLVRRGGFPDELLHSLLDADALTMRGATVELQHEALADYLRALDVIALPPAEASQRLKALPLREGSQLPALLMAIASTPEMQSLVWAQVVASDITAAMGALRYRAYISPNSDTPDLLDVSRRYLSEIMDGIELPLQSHFPHLSARILADLVVSDTERLGIVGAIQQESGILGYSFVACGPSESQVTVGRADGAGRYYGKNLLAMGLRLDSGRLVGMGHVRDSLLALIEERRLDGGVVWAEERTFGRLRHLVREYDLPYVAEMSLERARDLLIRNAGRWVRPSAFGHGQTFAINDLVAEIESLIAQGRTHLVPWWTGAGALDLATLEGKARFSEILDEHHRRTQLAYREVVETSFPLVADKLPLYQVVPVRFEIEVSPHSQRGDNSATLQWRWVPVATFDNVGATVEFPAKFSDIWSESAFDAYRQRIDKALAQYARHAPNRQYTWGQESVPNFVNDFPTHGGQVDETSVVRAVAAFIEAGIKEIFSKLPARDE